MTKKLIAVLLTFFLAGCAMPGKPPSPLISGETSSLIKALRQTNNGMTSFKGVGKFHFWNRAQSVSARAAWVGADEDRFRVEIFGISGHPDRAMACDGKWLYLLSKTEKHLYKQRAADGDLGRMLSIAIKPQDLVSLLAGRTPIPEYSFAELSADPVQGRVLLLRQGKHVVERVFFAEDMPIVSRIERFDRNGELLFQAVFEAMQTIDGNRVPERLSIIGPQARLVLTVERYWTFAKVSSEMFKLDNPF
jgi:hypothetical protein